MSNKQEALAFHKLITALPKRIASALIDQCCLAVAFAIFSIIEELIFSPEEISRKGAYMAAILFSVFLNKDIYFDKGIGKSFTGLNVVSVRTGRDQVQFNVASEIYSYCYGRCYLFTTIESTDIMGA